VGLPLPVRRPTLILVIACLAGCASYTDRASGVRMANVESDYEAVARVARAAADANPKDALVWKLEEGAALRAHGQLAESAKVFEEVEERLRAEEDKPGFSVTAEGLAAFTNDYAKEYRAKPYDRIYASTYQALNQIELGNPAAARVAMNRLRFVQESFGSSKIYLPPKADDKYDFERAAREERTKEGLAMIHEDLDDLAKDGAYDDAFSHWLQGMFFLRAGQDAADLERARKELMAGLALAPGCGVMKRDLADCEAILNRTSAAGRVVYVIAETGVCPAWREQRVDIPVFIVSSRIPFISVALPALRPVGADYKLGLQLDGKPVALDPASRTEALIAKHFAAALPGIQARAFTSAAVKAGTSYVLNKSTEAAARKDNASTGAVLLSVATKLATAGYTLASTKADIRNWSGLPARFSLARLDAPAGRKIAVAGHPEASLTLPPGKVLLVSIKSAGENQPVSLRCTTLVP
jgi:hypothetical protein